MAGFDRRHFLGAGSAGLALAGPLAALMAAQARAAEAALTNGAGAQLRPAESPYGPLAPVADETTGLNMLMLPRGFRYTSFGWTGDRMDDGLAVAGRHDGMAVVKTEGRDLIIIRNHEVRDGPLLAAPGGVYDAKARSGGGCTMVRLRDGKAVEQRAVLGGTRVNCAGGPTLWNSWLSCEETFEDLSAKGGLRHGYVFDVSAKPGETSAVPLTAMGRFRHEAVAADPKTGDIFLTEDDRNASALYRFRPARREQRYGALEAGGTLQAARVVGRPGANLLALAGPLPSDVRRVGETLAIEWVTLEAPDSAPVNFREAGEGNPATGMEEVSGPFAEARAKGALRMSRGEGLWWDPKSDAAYVVDTSFGVGDDGRPGRGLGGIWAYRPDRGSPDRGTLTLVYAAAARVAGNNPDNITVSPRGGLLTVDDGDAIDDGYGPGNRIMAYRADGLATIFGKNSLQLSDADLARIGRSGQFPARDYRESELCGACFSPDGETLLVNIQSPGVTLAIRGPWARGML